MLVGCSNVLFGTIGHQHGFLRLRSVEKGHVRSFAEIGKTIKAKINTMHPNLKLKRCLLSGMSRVTRNGRAAGAGRNRPLVP